jgi:hypothetical protein
MPDMRIVHYRDSNGIAPSEDDDSFDVLEATLALQFNSTEPGHIST